MNKLVFLLGVFILFAFESSCTICCDTLKALAEEKEKAYQIVCGASNNLQGCCPGFKNETNKFMNSYVVLCSNSTNCKYSKFASLIDQLKKPCRLNNLLNRLKTNLVSQPIVGNKMPPIQITHLLLKSLNYTSRNENHSFLKSLCLLPSSQLITRQIDDSNSLCSIQLKCHCNITHDLYMGDISWDILYSHAMQIF